MADRPSFAILGGGNGGFCTAADLTLRGFETRLFEFPAFAHTLDPVIREGGIHLRGVVGEGFARPAVITTDIKEAIDGVEIVLVIVPSAGHELAAKECAPVLKHDQIVVLVPGNCGGVLEFRSQLMRHGGPEEALLAETTTLMYAVKKENGNSVWARGVKCDLPLAALPAENGPVVLERLRLAFPQFRLAENVLDTGFNNLNNIVHPSGMLLNLGFIQGEAPADWYFYKEGYTPGVARVSTQMDRERLEVVRAFSLPSIPIEEALHAFYGHQGINGEGLYEIFSTSPIHFAARGPKTINHRMFTEDIPYGLVPLTSFARLAGVPTPVMDAVITLSSVVCDTNFYRTGRNLEKLGLEGFSKEDVLDFVITGKRIKTCEKTDF
jgi:opine dehydrogenase